LSAVLAVVACFACRGSGVEANLLDPDAVDPVPDLVVDQTPPTPDKGTADDGSTNVPDQGSDTPDAVPPRTPDPFWDRSALHATEMKTAIRAGA